MLDGVTSPHSRRAYTNRHWTSSSSGGSARASHRSPRRRSRRSAPSWRATDSAGATINVRLAAIRKLAVRPPTTACSIPTGGWHRTGQGRETARRPPGQLVDAAEAQALLGAPDAATVKGKRDRAILAVLLGCALRRRRLAALTVEHIQQRDGRWVFADLVGKGGRVRTVPVPAWVKVAIDEWTEAAGIESGRVWRSINRGGRVWGDGLTEKVIWQVSSSTRLMAGSNIAPHDLRRTSAKLCRAGGGELEQIQMLLGHASVQTTERYLGDAAEPDGCAERSYGVGARERLKGRDGVVR